MIHDTIKRLTQPHKNRNLKYKAFPFFVITNLSNHLNCENSLVKELSRVMIMMIPLCAAVKNNSGDEYFAGNCSPNGVIWKVTVVKNKKPANRKKTHHGNGSFIVSISPHF